MKIYYIAILSFLAFLTLSCTDEEVLTASDIDTMSRFEFPEGDDECDLIFEEIYNEFGIQIIYKGWTQKDWYKTWLNPGAAGFDMNKNGRHFVKGEVDSALVAAKFMRDNIFVHLKPKSFSGLRPTIFLVNS